MPINFPNSPSFGDNYTWNGIVYTFDGVKWTSQTAQGVQGIVGNQGVQGVQGIQGNNAEVQGIQGTQGTLGIQGIQGRQGIQGQQGIQGIDGTLGAQGPQGTQGRQGTTGAQGIQGIDGTLGAQGPQGTQGTAITIVGSIPVVGGDPQANLNAAYPAASIGDGVIAQDTGDLWIYDGSLWNNVGQIRGPQGTQGTQGNTGVQGTQGRQGTTGAQGIQGIDGTLGAQGIQGLQGLQGTTGAQGIQGIDGTLGAQGIQGLQGIQGTTGAQGIQGIQGIQGRQGTTGAQGVQGTTGAQGVQGIQGIQGIQGNTGIQGSDGNAEQIDSINDSTTTMLYPVMVTGTGTQIARITTDPGKLNFNANTGVLTTTASSALYADLAEKYEIDEPLVSGSVVVFGGDKEITACREKESAAIAGVISTQPGLMMNTAAGDDCTHPYVALRGRVPCRVVGVVKPGDVLITSATPGCAEVAPDPKTVPAACIVGKAITEKSTPLEGTVEIMV